MSAPKFIIKSLRNEAKYQQMWEDGLNTDFEIICEDDSRIKCHIFILICSGFAVRPADGSSEIYVPIKREVVYKLIDYCYSKELVVEHTEFIQVLKALTFLNAPDLFHSIENYFARQLQYLTAPALEMSPACCLQSLIYKSGHHSGFWMEELLKWVDADPERRANMLLPLLKSTLVSPPKEYSCYEDLKLITSRIDTRGVAACLKKIRFSLQRPCDIVLNKCWLRYDGTDFRKYMNFEEEPRAVFLISKQKGQYLELCQDGTLLFKQGRNTVEFDRRVLAYCLNPQLFFFEGDVVTKVSDYGVSDIFKFSEAVQELPQLQNVLPPAIDDGKVYEINFIDDQLAVMRDAAKTEYSHQAIIAPNRERPAWQAISKSKLTYLDTHDGEIFGVTSDGSISQMFIQNNKIQTRCELCKLRESKELKNIKVFAHISSFGKIYYLDEQKNLHLNNTPVFRHN